MAKSLYLRNKVLTDSLTAAPVYLALFEGDPEDGGTEISGGGYSRKAITFGAVADGKVTNTAAISYVNLPASQLTHWGIVDEISGGNYLYLQQFGVNIVLADGSPLDVASGNIVITED